MVFLSLVLIYLLIICQNGGAWAKSALPLEVCGIDLEPEDFITAFDYLAEKESLLIGTSCGLLLVHNVESNATELVGNIEGGVKCVSPSPTGDLLGLITGFGQLLVMTYDWVLMYERAIEEVPEGVYVRKDPLPLLPKFSLVHPSCLLDRIGINFMVFMLNTFSPFANHVNYILF